MYLIINFIGRRCKKIKVGNPFWKAALLPTNFQLMTITLKIGCVTAELCKDLYSTTIILIGESRVDMLDLMLQSRSIADEKMSLCNEDIVDDILLFTVAGHETATNVLSWTLYELARNPDIQTACRQEVENVLSQANLLDYDSADK